MDKTNKTMVVSPNPFRGGNRTMGDTHGLKFYHKDYYSNVDFGVGPNEFCYPDWVWSLRAGAHNRYKSLGTRYMNSLE